MKLTPPVAALALALALSAPAGASHQSFSEALTAATVDGRVFPAASDLRRHVLRSGRSWERFLDRRPRVVSAYHLRPVVLRRQTFFSAHGVRLALERRGRSFARWARTHPAARARLRRNAAARLPRPVPNPTPLPPPPPPSPPASPTPPPAPPAPPPTPPPPVEPPPTPPPPPAPPPTPPPPPAPPPTPPRPLALGFALENPEFSGLPGSDRTLSEIVAAGGRWIRFDVKWSDVQRLGPTTYDWAKYDALVSAARARGLKVLGSLAYSPTWARPAGTTNKYAPDTTARREAYARFAAAAAARYRDGVSAWEIWNEANNTMFWEPLPNPASYVALLQHSYRAIKGANPQATVVGGATSPAPSFEGLIDEVDFIQAVYAAGGRGYFDAWSHHPYDFNLPPGTAHKDSAWWQTYGATPNVRSVMVENGDGGMEIWATEYGLPSGGYGGLSETVQAEWLASAFAQWRRFPWSGPIFNYMVRDGVAPLISPWWYHVGVVRDDWTRKPSFSVMQEHTAP